MATGDGNMFVAVAGSIAAGKTGLVDRLAEALDAIPLREEVARNPYFDRFYQDPERWAFHSQVAFAADSISRHVHATRTERVVQDRTVYEVVDVFGRLLVELGNLDAEELRILEDIRNGAREIPRQPTAMVYLHAPTSVLLDRAAKRGRPAERHLTSSYLERLGRGYDRFAAEWAGCPVLSIDTTDRDLRADSELNRLVDELRTMKEI